MGMSKSRGYQPKKRGQVKRERRSVIVLSTEGKNETETNYFKEFGKAKNRIIRFAPGIPIR